QAMHASAWREKRAGAWPARNDLLGFGLGGVAIRLAHLHKSLALAGILALARVVGALTRRVSLAGIHTLALHFGLVSTGAADRCGGEHHRRGRGQGNTGQHFRSHSQSPLEPVERRRLYALCL